MAKRASGSPATSDRLAHLTDAQRQAVHTIDRSVLVSAAAGSGKTTVLAERCATLVCDLPPEQRCSVDRLLVVTFTDAAAGEMRTRISNAIRQRLADSPRDSYLQKQLHLIDSASISTIHSFCKSLIRRWFPQAGVDPQFTMLSGEEAELLRRETLDDLFETLYAGDDDLPLRFQRLIDDYGAGRDETLAEVVLKAHQFVSSLTNPDEWLDRVVSRLDPNGSESLASRVDSVQSDRLRNELIRLIEFAQVQAATIEEVDPMVSAWADDLEESGALFGEWHEKLRRGDSWESVLREIGETKLPFTARQPRGASEEEKETYEIAKDLRNHVRTLFEKRLKERLCSLTRDQMIEGLERIRPYTHTIVDLVRELTQRFQAAKSEQATLDFNDLQRFAYQVLTEDGDENRPSDVARQLQARYDYVLVDEFQDVDPLQAGILKLVSRERDETKPSNLFTVGDIKQSIYRFRLAEPELFIQRAEEFEKDINFGVPIHLQENFRSRSGVIEAINLIFEPLMSKTFGGSDYNEAARLYPGATYPQESDSTPVSFAGNPVELHVLEKVTEATRVDGEDEEGSNGDSDDNWEELEGIEREAFLIGRRIQQWIGTDGRSQRMHVADKAARPGEPPTLRPIEYRDIVILLRSLSHKVEPITDVLRRMKIPVIVDSTESSLDSTEFRDLHGLLQLLDNPRQDIPLAAVMRSPLFRERFSESELLRIRLAHKHLPFHEAVPAYASQGEDKPLRERLDLYLKQIERYRTRMQREPVAEVLWDIYEKTGYFAYVAGLPDGTPRQTHLIQLHEMARQFGRFHRQGLQRFLRFIDDMVAQGKAPSRNSSASTSENGVRIMTIHASKGLEFPVVILADAAKPFNLGDSRGTILMDRANGLALKAADADKRVYYPTLIQQLAAESIQRENLAEELRILYVALTRAKEHLMIVGRADLKKLQTLRNRYARDDTSDSQDLGEESRKLPQIELETAGNVSDWLLPAVFSVEPRQIAWLDQETADRPSASGALFSVSVHDRRTTDQWAVPPAIQNEREEELRSYADLQPLADEEPMAEPEQATPILDRLSHVYEGLELTGAPARLTVSELKRRWATETADVEREASRPFRKPKVPRPAFIEEHAPDAAERGLATHRFLQLVDLRRSCDPSDLKQQLRELTGSGRMSPENGELVMLDAVSWFFDSDLGQRVRAHPNQVRREVPFVSRIDPARYDAMLAARDDRDIILTRGMVDLVLIDGDKLHIIDYKTDEIAEADCAKRAMEYQPQLELYADAMAHALHRKVASCRLVFLHARTIVDIADVGH